MNKKSIKICQDKEIRGLGIVDNVLLFTFTDGSRMRLFDNEQMCCEIRSMSTDDDLSYFAGAMFCDIEVRDGPKGEEIDSQFLVVSTSKGAFTVVNYNEHNGYYDRFDIVAETDAGEESLQ